MPVRVCSNASSTRCEIDVAASGSDRSSLEREAVAETQLQRPSFDTTAHERSPGRTGVTIDHDAVHRVPTRGDLAIFAVEPDDRIASYERRRGGPFVDGSWLEQARERDQI